MLRCRRRRWPVAALPVETRRGRAGISLLEVLMSIFVISIGLLGVVALLPLGNVLTERGIVADTAAIAGKAASREIAIREYHNPDNWLTAAGAVVSLDVTGSADANKPMQPVGSKAYCLDPRGVAAGITANFPNGGSPAMPRLTLRANSGGLSGAGTSMTAFQADDSFTLRNDLEFIINQSDTTAEPQQKMEGTERRYSRSDFSWFATFVREGTGDLYTVSTVVVRGRNSNTLAATSEQTASLTFVGGGLGGGEVTITGAATAGLRVGQWIMVAKAERFRWYRIVGIGEFVDASTAREVTLAGRDWDIASSYNTAQATIMGDVVAVYERNMRLESSSLWQRGTPY